VAQFINKRNLRKYKPLGIRNPIRNAGQDGVFDMTSKTLERVKSSLYTLLFTAPGTRVQMPEFGSPIYALHFEQVSKQDFDRIDMAIRDAIKRWVPEASIREILISQNENNPNEFNFNIRFALTQNPALEDSLVITVR
jgi:phage baseplate assembly protein W